MQLLGHGCETAKHHLNPSSGEAKNGTVCGPETAPLEPSKEKKRAPVRRPKTWRNLAWTNAKRQPLGNGSETAKHHLWKTVKREVIKGSRKVTTNWAEPGMDDMYAVDGQRHAWAGHSCGAVQDKALKFFPYASPSGKAEGSADIFQVGWNHQLVLLLPFVRIHVVCWFHMFFFIVLSAKRSSFHQVPSFITDSFISHLD